MAACDSGGKCCSASYAPPDDDPSTEAPNTSEPPSPRENTIAFEGSSSLEKMEAAKATLLLDLRRSRRSGLDDPEGSDCDDIEGQEGVLSEMPTVHRRRMEVPMVRSPEQQAMMGATTAICHGRRCLEGLVLVNILRIVAYCAGNSAFTTILVLHGLCFIADSVSFFAAIPLFTPIIVGACVQRACVGPMMTLVLTMCLIETGALIMVICTSSQRPARQSASGIEVAEAAFDVWALALVTSVCLQSALCASAFRVYRELRIEGAYPPHSRGRCRQPVQVEALEIICEAEDVALLSSYEKDVCTSLDRGSCISTPSEPQTPHPPEARTEEVFLPPTEQEAFAGKRDWRGRRL